MRRLFHVVVCTALLMALSGCILSSSYRERRYLESGKRFAQEGKTAQATIQFLNAIQLDPKFTPAHYELARLATKAGNTTMAFMEYSEVVDRDPANLDAQVQLGKLMLARGDAAGAQAKAKLTLRSQPDNYDAHVLLAGSYGPTGETKLGIAEALNSVKLDPKRPDAYLTAAKLQEQEQDFAGAGQNYQQALAVAPDNLGVLLAIAQNSLRLGKGAEADQYLQKAIAVAGNTNPQPRLMRVVLLLQSGRFSDAEALARDTQKAMPDISEAATAVGDLYIAVYDLGRAFAEYEPLFKAHPDDLRTRKNYVQLLILLGRIDQARKMNDAMLRLLGDDPDVILQRGEILIRDGRVRDAVSVLQKGVNLQPNSYMGHYQLGRALMMTEALAEAQHQFEEAVRLEPRRAEANLALADLAVRKHDLDLLTTVRITLSRLAPSSAVAYQLKAAEELARRQPALADAEFKKAIEVEPGNPNSYTRYADFLIYTKKNQEAEAVLKRAIAAVPGSHETYGLLVAFYISQHRAQDALSLLDSASPEMKETSAYYSLRGSVLMELGNLADAAPALDKAISLDSRNSEAWLLRGRCYVAHNQVDKAVETYQAWTRAVPGDTRGFLMLGELYERQGNYQQGQDFYRKALAVDPENPYASNNLAFSLLEHEGDADKALSYAMAAMRKLGSPITGDTLGWAYYHTGQYEKAQQILTAVAKRLPNDAGVQYHLGLTYLKLTDPQQATLHLKKAIELDPKYVHGDEIRLTLVKMKQPNEMDRSSRNPLLPDVH